MELSRTSGVAVASRLNIVPGGVSFQISSSAKSRASFLCCLRYLHTGKMRGSGPAVAKQLQSSFFPETR